MRWFGPRWDALVCDYGAEVAVPTGLECEYCHAPIVEADRGFLLVYYGQGAKEDWPIHLDCMLTSLGVQP